MEESQGLIRSFIAVNLPSDIKEHLYTVSIRFREYLKDQRTHVTWIKGESMHLTLKFFGSIDRKLIDPIIDNMQRAVADINRFSIVLGDMGVFPNQNRPRVIWVGLKAGAEEINLLQKCIEHGLEELGFESEKREFSPHLTLGRIKGLGSRGEILRALRALQDVNIGRAEVACVSLMKSRLTPKGAIYTELGSVALK